MSRPVIADMTESPVRVSNPSGLLDTLEIDARGLARVPALVTESRIMRIVVGVDGSEQALVGARWVTQLPLARSDEVTVAAIAQRPVLLGSWGYLVTTASDDLRQAAWDAAHQAAKRAGDEATSVLQVLPCPITTVVREGHPLDALSRLAEDSAADLVVVGPHGRSRLESILLGSVSQGLLQEMPASMLVAREPVTPPVRVLLAADGSAPSLAAARYLGRFPLPKGARIDVVTVTTDWIGRQTSDQRARAASVLDSTIKVLAGSGRDGSPVIRHGDVKRQILAAADDLESDLIISGARGLGGFSGMVLGSVSRALSKAAHCSVLVVAHRLPPT